MWLFPIGLHMDYGLGCFGGGRVLAEDFLINVILNEGKYKYYLPGGVSLKSVSRGCLLSVNLDLISWLMAFVTPNASAQIV